MLHLTTLGGLALQRDGEMLDVLNAQRQLLFSPRRAVDGAAQFRILGPSRRVATAPPGNVQRPTFFQEAA